MRAAAFVEDDEAVGVRATDARMASRRSGARGAEVEEVEGLFVFGFQILGGLGGEVGHLAVGDEGGVPAGADVAGLPDLAVVGIPRHSVFAAPVEGLVFEEEDGVVILVGGEQAVEGILGGARVEGP